MFVWFRLLEILIFFSDICIHDVNSKIWFLIPVSHFLTRVVGTTHV